MLLHKDREQFIAIVNAVSNSCLFLYQLWRKIIM